MKECSKCQQCYEDSHSVCSLDNNPLIFTVDVDVIVSGRYLLEKRLGRGGMGIVFKAKHKFLKSSHAIKVILPSLVEKDINLLVRFKQEAVLAASIDHPNVIRVTDFGVENEKMPYLVMEFVDGTPLSLFLAHDNRLPVETAFEFFQPIALGVAEAHRKGIVHRDLKPQNIMVQKGLPLYKAVRVLDFGLAKIKSVESFGSLIQAQTMNVMGSPQYMSPEQWEDEEPDHRTDIYALGVILFQMLTGQLPFQSDSIPSVMYQHLTAPPPAFASLGVSLPQGIEAVVRRALEKDPKARPNSIEEMLSEFEEALANSGITVPLSGFAPHRSKKTDASSIAKTSVLTDSQQEKLQTFFDASITQNITSDNRLAQEFLKAQERAEKAEVKANQADKLVQEFAEAQKAAERAQQQAVEAKERIEAELRRRLEAEMESKLAEQQARQKAESERLAREAEARKQAEERANYLAQAALEAQNIAEAERKKAEQAAHQRELEESVRRRAEIAASQLSEQVSEAKRKFEEAKKQAEYEAELRKAAELKRQKIESELLTLAEKEAERRAKTETEARRLAQQQAEKFEQEAITAQKRVEEARRLAELEAKKREEAELAKRRAEEEVRRLGQEIIEVQKRMEEIKMHSSSAPDQTLNLLEFHSSGNVSAQTGGSSSSEKNPLDSSNETLPRVDVFGESPAQANTVANQTTPFVNVGEQPSSAQERSRITIETQSPPKSNPTFSNLFDSGSVKNRKVPIALMAAGGLFVLLTFLIGGFLIYAFVIQEPEQPVVTENPKKTETNSLPTNDTANTKPPLKTEPQTVMVEGASFQMGRS
ncbi:MAG TPA: protein kinase, partial [Pyrinomonadaceae bacterium]|nr:protein kinase [Pyrinomonadaceae bacterium]